MTLWKRLLLPVAVALAAIPTHAAPPTPDFANLPGYIRALNQSKDPQAVAIRRQIADGPAALARERAACEADGISLDSTASQPTVPPDQDATPLWEKWNTLRLGHLQLPLYADSLSANYAYTPEQLARIQKMFDDNREAMDALHQATARSFLMIPNGDYSEYARLREAARELKSESFLLAHQGRYAEAVADQARGFQITKQLASHSILIGYLVGNAMEAITLSGMRDILYMAGPNADVSTQVQQAIQAAQPVLSLKSALLGETAYSLSFMDKARTEQPNYLAEMAHENTDSSRISPSAKSFTPDERRFADDLLDASEAAYLSQMRRLVDAADLPYAARRATFRGIQNLPNQPPLNPVDQLNPILGLDQILLSVSGRMDENDDRIHAQEEVTLAAASVLAARSRTGVFPDALPDTFTDPFTGKPLGYRREGDGGFVVYSVGADGKFGGGKTGEYKFTPTQAFFRYPGPTPQPVPQDMLK